MVTLSASNCTRFAAKPLTGGTPLPMWLAALDADHLPPLDLSACCSDRSRRDSPWEKWSSGEHPATGRLIPAPGDCGPGKWVSKGYARSHFQHLAWPQRP